MKVLVVYHSLSGNTKKVAEAVYEEIIAEKDILPVAEVTDVCDYDLVFLAFWLNNWKPCEEVEKFMSEVCTGKRLALLVTHACPVGSDSQSMWLPNCLEAVSAARLEGVFDCRGELSQAIKQIMLKSPVGEVRRWAEMDDSQGQPDADSLLRSRTFARQIMEQVETTPV